MEEEEEDEEDIQRNIIQFCDNYFEDSIKLL